MFRKALFDTFPTQNRPKSLEWTFSKKFEVKKFHHTNLLEKLTAIEFEVPNKSFMHENLSEVVPLYI